MVAIFYLYSAVIRQRGDVSNVTMFHYLYSQLTGDAWQFMVGFNRKDSKYEEAALQQKQMNGNKNKLIKPYLVGFFKLKHHWNNIAIALQISLAVRG